MEISSKPQDNLMTEEVHLRNEAHKEINNSELLKFQQTKTKVIIDAIRSLGDAKGSSFADIKKYVEKEMDGACNSTDIKLRLKHAVDRGDLSLMSGNYKINERRRRRRSRSGGRSKRRKRSGSRKRRRSSGSRRRSGRRRGGRKRSSSRRRRRRQHKGHTDGDGCGT